MGPVRLLGEVSCSTKCVEDPDAAGNHIRRLHPHCGRKTLAKRCLIKNAAPLFVKSAGERKEMRLVKATERLGARVPARTSGRHMYMKSCGSRNRMTARWSQTGASVQW